MANIAVLYKSDDRTPMIIEQHHKEMLQAHDPSGCIRYFETEEELLSSGFQAEILITWGLYHPNEYCSRCKSLKWIQVLSAGVEGVTSLDAVKNGDITVTKMAGMHGIPMSESVVCFILAFLIRLPKLMAQQKKHLWKRPDAPSPDECRGKTCAIIGMGDIGSEVAKRCKFLGMRVIGCRRHPREMENVDEMFSLQQLKEVLSQADFVVSLVPSSPEAAKMFGKEQFGWMKEAAVFINVGRGMVVDHEALAGALAEGGIAGAALDALDPEPLPGDSPLWDMENVIITPHCSAVTPFYFDRAMEIIGENLDRYLAGEELKHVIR